MNETQSGPDYGFKMLKVSAKIEIQFIPTTQFTRLTGIVLLVLHWLGFL